MSAQIHGCFDGVDYQRHIFDESSSIRLMRTIAYKVDTSIVILAGYYNDIISEGGLVFEPTR